MKFIVSIIVAILVILTPQLLLADDPFAVDAQAKILFEKAVAEFKAGHLEAAGSHARLAWKKDRGVMGLDDSGMIDGFDKHLRNKIKKSPDDVTAYYKLAKLQAVRGLPKEAVTLFQKVIELSPGTPLAKKAQTFTKGLGSNLAEQDYLDADREEFIKESREEATIENIKLSNEELAEENARLKKEELANSNASRQLEADAKDKRIAELEKENKENKLTTDLFWANPTNAYLMKNNYDKNRVKADLKDRGIVKPRPVPTKLPVKQ